jgi:hypothetical protein
MVKGSLAVQRTNESDRLTALVAKLAQEKSVADANKAAADNAAQAADYKLSAVLDTLKMLNDPDLDGVQHESIQHTYERAYAKHEAPEILQAPPLLEAPSRPRERGGKRDAASAVNRSQRAKDIYQFAMERDGRFNVNEFRKARARRYPETWLKTSLYTALRQMTHEGIMEKVGVGHDGTYRIVGKPVEGMKNRQMQPMLGNLPFELPPWAKDIDANALKPLKQREAIRVFADAAKGPFRLIEMARALKAYGKTSSTPEVATAGISSYLDDNPAYEKVTPGVWQLKGGKHGNG